MPHVSAVAAPRSIQAMAPGLVPQSRAVYSYLGVDGSASANRAIDTSNGVRCVLPGERRCPLLPVRCEPRPQVIVLHGAASIASTVVSEARRRVILNCDGRQKPPVLGCTVNGANK
jgi:hypothetical protein